MPNQFPTPQTKMASEDWIQMSKLKLEEVTYQLIIFSNI